MILSNKSLWIICGTLEAGGAERIISILSSFFVNRFNCVKILTWREAPLFYEFDERVEIISIPSLSKKESLLGKMLWFRRYVRQNKPDVLLSFLAPFNMLTLMSLVGSGQTVLIADRNDPVHDCPNYIWRKIRNMLYRMADGVAVQTLNNKNYFSSRIRKKTEIIYNPVFLPSQLIGQALDAPKLKTIVSVGRLEKQKNQELLLDAFAIVHKYNPSYQLIIYGEGELREILEKKVDSLGLKEVVKLPGAVTDLHRKILNADVFVMSSDYEGMSNALIEAMCLGLPCISTKVSGAVDLIQENKNGILVELGDKEGLAKAILNLIEDKSKAEQLAREGVKLAEELQIGFIVDKWIEFLGKGLAGH